MQRDEDDDGFQHGRIEDDAGALEDQIDLLTQRLAKVNEADDKHDIESVGADVADTLQDIPCSFTSDVSPGSHTTTRARHIMKAGWSSRV